MNDALGQPGLGPLALNESTPVNQPAQPADTTPRSEIPREITNATL